MTRKKFGGESQGYVWISNRKDSCGLRRAEVAVPRVYLGSQRSLSDRATQGSVTLSESKGKRTRAPDATMSSDSWAT
jgi:hypothetical protein